MPRTQLITLGPELVGNRFCTVERACARQGGVNASGFHPHLHGLCSICIAVADRQKGKMAPLLWSGVFGNQQVVFAAKYTGILESSVNKGQGGNIMRSYYYLSEHSAS